MALLLVALFTVAARAEDPWDGWASNFLDPADEVMWLRGVTSVYIESQDSVSDGCWTNESATRTAIELSLRGAGIAVETEEAWEASHVLFIIANGGKAGGSCYGKYRLSFEQLVSANVIVPGAVGFVIFSPLSAGGILSGYETMNETVRTFVIEKTDAIALRILRARDAE